ncbi:HD domain-containing protein [Psychrobacter sp. DM4]|uniref:HD domain-containing protein n=1 Tax=Psychrobacter sp. DM4 TaxID=3440637 RepID=UPI003F5018F7
MSKKRHLDLSERFAAHLSAINESVAPNIALTLWQDIATRYSEHTRAYHTLEHLTQLFSQFDKIKDALAQPDIVALAVYYHDVIYDPRRSDNELKSAEYVQEKLHSCLDSKQCQRIYELIIMTANHNVIGADNSLDAAYLLDMDLSILGAPWMDYEQYAQAVRKEYAHVPKANYRTGRIAVLESLLAHPKLYLTEHYDQLESQARSNIRREIILLADS